MIELHCDGSCLDNQSREDSRGGAGYVVVRDDERVAEGSEFLGDGEDVTNNSAEYDAVLAALEWRAENTPDEDVTVYTDSRLIVKQILGEWNCNEDHLRSRAEEARERLHPEDEIVEADDSPHLSRAHTLAQAGAAETDPSEVETRSKRRTSSGRGSVTEIDLDELDEVPGPVDQPHEWLIPENIPDELKRRPQWINWIYGERNDKMTKIPWQGWEMTTAKANDPETFTDFATAVGSVFQYVPNWISNYSKYVPSVGFVLTTGDPYCVIDLDDCRDADTGDVDQWAIYIVENLESYCQVSASGTGLHVFLKDAEVPEPWKNKKEEKREMEIYHWGRFITMTGKLYDDRFDAIESRPEFGNWVLELEDKLYG